MTWTFGEFHLDPDRFQLTRRGAAVRVEPQVLALLIHLVRNRDRMVPKDEIAAEVWRGHPVSDASISSRIRSARQAVADDGARQEVIRTVHGRGFRFVAEVAPPAPAAPARPAAPGPARRLVAWAGAGPEAGGGAASLALGGPAAPGAGTGPGRGSGRGAGAGAAAGEETGPGAGSGAGAGAGSGAGAGRGPGTRTGSGAGSGTGSGTASGTASGTGSETGPGTGSGASIGTARGAWPGIRDPQAVPDGGAGRAMSSWAEAALPDGPGAAFGPGAGPGPEALPWGGRPSIAVLPFQPLGASPELSVLGEAIPHEIIEALSRLRWLAVIARGSTFRFGRAGADLDLVATALSARYVLTGVVEGRGSGLAVTLELTEARSRQILWADRLEAPRRGVDLLRSRIVAHLVAALETRIPFHEASVAELHGPEGLDAWSHYHVGLRHLYRFTAGDTALARTAFERAVAGDPGFARAHAGLSFTSFLTAFLRLGPDTPAATVAARRHAERALELDPMDPFANFTMGRSFWLTGEPETAAEWLSRAITLNPNYAQGFYASGFTAMLSGDAGATLAAIDTALRLSPLDPLLYGVHGVRAQMLLQQEEYEAAAHWGDRAATLPGAHYLIAMIALVANGLAGHTAQAARWRQEVRRRKPDATAADYFAAFPTRHAPSRAAIAAELRRHGF